MRVPEKLPLADVMVSTKVDRSTSVTAGPEVEVGKKALVPGVSTVADA
jgi:hypothetical protein